MTVSPSLSLPLSLSPSLPLSLSPSLPLSLSLALSLSPSLSRPLALSPSLPLSLSPSLSVALCPSLCLHLCVMCPLTGVTGRVAIVEALPLYAGPCPCLTETRGHCWLDFGQAGWAVLSWLVYDTVDTRSLPCSPADCAGGQASVTNQYR